MSECAQLTGICARDLRRVKKVYLFLGQFMGGDTARYLSKSVEWLQVATVKDILLAIQVSGTQTADIFHGGGYVLFVGQASSGLSQ